MIQSGLFINGGLIGNLISLPIDYTKTYLQIHKTLPRVPIRYKYIGLDAVFIKNILMLKMKHKLYKLSTEENKSFLVIGTCFISFLLTPFDTILTKLQTKHISTQFQFTNTLDTCRYIVKNSGIKGLYAGSVAGTLKMLSFCIAGQISNITLYPFYLIIWKYYLLMVCMIPHTVFSHPFDVVKAFMQKCEVNGQRYKGFVDCCLGLYKEFGMEVFYRGLLHAYVRNCIVVGLTATVLEMHHRPS